MPVSQDVQDLCDQISNKFAAAEADKADAVAQARADAVAQVQQDHGDEIAALKAAAGL